jgi:phage gp46-like protein
MAAKPVIDYSGDAMLSQVGSAFDITIRGNDLDRDRGLQTAILLCINTERRTNNERGWWGDPLFGSRTWKYERATITEEFLSSIASDFVEDLKWLVEDGVAKKIAVEAAHANSVNEVKITFKITLPYFKNNNKFFTFYYNVQNQLLRY